MEVCNFVQEAVSKPSPRSRNATMQNGFLRRTYKEMKKEEKQSTKDKRENIPIRMQNPKNSKERYESLVK